MMDNEKSQNTEQMTPDEIKRLQEVLEEHNASPARHILIPAFFVLLLGIAAFVTPFATEFFFSAILFWPLAGTAFWFARHSFKVYSEYSQRQINLEDDLKTGTKETFHGEIQKKRETRGKYGNWHFITILDKEYPVDVTTYTRFDTGDQVAVSLSEKARTIIEIKKSTTKPRNPAAPSFTI